MAARSLKQEDKAIWLRLAEDWLKLAQSATKPTEVAGFERAVAGFANPDCLGVPGTTLTSGPFTRSG
jgi:hypothetical protein